MSKKENANKPILNQNDPLFSEYMHFCDVIDSFKFYKEHIHLLCSKALSDYELLLPKYKNLIPDFERQQRKCAEVSLKNQILLDKIVLNAEENFRVDLKKKFSGESFDRLRSSPQNPKEMYLDKVVSTVKQFAREWSQNGESERETCYGSVLKELEECFPVPEERADIKVLNPGCGLARLTWEIAKRGFCSQGNEFSYFMLFASFYILNCSKRNEFAIHPYAHMTKNITKFENRVREVRVPDVDTSDIPPNRLSMSAGDFVDVYGGEQERGSWDAIVSVFFLDTAHNILQYLELVAWLLKPGGVFINFGPLLYHFADLKNEFSLEIDLESVRNTLAPFGLEITKEQVGLPSTYCNDTLSMSRTQYDCALWVCKKKYLIERPIFPKSGNFYGGKKFDTETRIGGLTHLPPQYTEH